MRATRLRRWGLWEYRGFGIAETRIETDGVEAAALVLVGPGILAAYLADPCDADLAAAAGEDVRFGSGLRCTTRRRALAVQRRSIDALITEACDLCKGAGLQEGLGGRTVPCDCLPDQG